MSFSLPTGYVIPQKETSYMKFQDGENRFRILSEPIIGNLWWTKDKEGKNKPNRIRMNEKIPSEVDLDDVRHFWAMFVYNYHESKIQVLEVTQKVVLKAIKSLLEDPDWGDPCDYDLSILKTGEKKSTKFQVSPKPKKELDLSIKQKFENMETNLDALFEGGDPFKSLSNAIKKPVAPTEPVSDLGTDMDIPF